MAKNLTLGRGELHFAQYLAGTQQPLGERYLGNSPEFSATIESNQLDHMDSDHGINEKDDSIALSTNRTGSFVTDNIDPKNVALFFFGSSEVLTQTSATVAGEVIAHVNKGLTYQLGMTASNPSGVRKLDSTTPVTLTLTGTPATAYVIGTDFTVDYETGRITLLDTGTAITEDSSLTAGYKTLAAKRTRIISGSTPIIGALRYIAFNPAGDNLDWYMPYVKITPNGDYTLKGDTWQQIPFNIEILKKTGLEAIYIDGRAYIA